jgi:hypothetical protein
MREVAAAKCLLNPIEQVLYGRLVRAFPGHIVLARVALSRQLVVDFAVLRSDFTVLAAVELCSRAKPRIAQREREARMEAALHAARVKLLRLVAEDIPSDAALKALVAALPLASAGTPMRRAS